MAVEARPVLLAISTTTCDTSPNYSRSLSFPAPTVRVRPRVHSIIERVGDIRCSWNQDVVVHRKLRFSKNGNQLVCCGNRNWLNKSPVSLLQMSMLARIPCVCPILYIALQRMHRILPWHWQWSREVSGGCFVSRWSLGSTPDSGCVPKSLLARARPCYFGWFFSAVVVNLVVVILIKYLVHGEHLSRLRFRLHVFVNVLPGCNYATLIHDINRHVEIREMLLDTSDKLQPGFHTVGLCARTVVVSHASGSVSDNDVVFKMSGKVPHSLWINGPERCEIAINLVKQILHNECVMLVRVFVPRIKTGRRLAPSSRSVRFGCGMFVG